MLDGYFRDKLFILPVRIYYADTDASGVVYHSTYFDFMERGRAEFFRAVGIEKLIDLDSEDPTAWALRHAEIDYIRPARLDDIIEIRTRAVVMRGARIEIHQDIYCGEDHLTRGRVEACVMTLDGKPRRIPADIRDKILPYLFPEEEK